MSAYPLKWYHKVGGFVCGKAREGVLSIPNSPLSYPTTQTKLSSPPQTTLLTTTTPAPPDNIFILPHYHTTPTAMKPPNIPYKKTLYINNTIIP